MYNFNDMALYLDTPQNLYRTSIEDLRNQQVLLELGLIVDLADENAISRYAQAYDGFLTMGMIVLAGHA